MHREIYQIKVTLRGSQPTVWRRMQVKSDTTLAKLHRILQCVMGWEDVHLHNFVIQGQRYGVSAEHHHASRETRDERKCKLCEIVEATNGQFVYHYDLGDDWLHTLEIEKTFPPEERVRYPICLTGACACPPEAVGGIPGYENFLEALGNPKHSEHDELLEWIGGTFDPEAFDLIKVNGGLRAMR
jgi:Plasmid pRiA4b ORF-3-like protein